MLNLKLQSRKRLYGAFAALSIATMSLFAVAPVQGQDTSGPLTDLIDNGDNVFTSPWLGHLFIESSFDPWVFHFQHGWLALNDMLTNDEFIFYDPVIPAWLGTTRDIYPFIYVFDETTPFWTYFYDGLPGLVGEPRRFYSYATEMDFFLSDGLELNVTGRVHRAQQLSTLVAALLSAELADDLTTDGPFTVFAPNNEAFAKLPDGTVESLLLPENQQQLIDILLYHVISGAAVTSDMVTTSFPETMSGLDIALDPTDGVVVNGVATVVEADVEVTNGVIHVIDTVLLPPVSIVETAVANGNFTTLATALVAAELNGTLESAGNFTVFAPTDAAFANVPNATLDFLLLPENQQILANVLLYHVIGDTFYSVDLSNDLEVPTLLTDANVTIGTEGGVTVNGANVTLANVLANNGVIHVIDEVLLPLDDIPTTADNAGTFTTLLTAVTTAELAELLSGPGPFTVFAPNDEAFDKLPDGTVADLLLEQNRQALIDLLSYHVVDGAAYSPFLVDGSVPTLLEGASVMIEVTENGVVINGTTNVIGPDVLASNGVIHVIDEVLMLPEM